MIDYISGTVAELTPTTAVIDCNGIGYEINITLTDFNALQNAADGKLYVHESIREDAHILFGFLSRRARALFRLLIGVSGVGPTMGRLILSSMTTEQLETCIASSDDSSLRAVKGIGAKTAQRIIVDLHDKIKGVESTLISSVATNKESFEEALAALTTLGFQPSAAQKALKKLFAEDGTLSTQDAIRKSLKML